MLNIIFKGEALRILLTNSSVATFEEKEKKKAVDGQRLSTQFKRKFAITNKTERKEVRAPETKLKGRKRHKTSP